MAGDKQPMVGKNFRCFGFCCFYPTDAQENAPTAILLTDGMQGLVNTNGDLVDRVHWKDLEAIQWMTINITDIPIEELARRMKIIAERSNVINQTIAATLDEDNLERILDVTRFGIENGYRLRYNKNLFKGLDAE